MSQPQPPVPPVAPPAAKPGLTPRQRKAAMLAGGVAGGLFGIGWGILGIVAFLAIIVVAFGLVLSAFFGGADLTGGLTGILAIIVVVAFVVGAVLVVLAVVISRRILRNGGVNRPTAVTWLSLLIALALNTVVQTIAAPALQPGEGDVPGWVRILVGIIVAAVAVGGGIGIWLLMAHAFRNSGAPVVAPIAPGAVPVAPISPPEPPAATLTTPPPAPPTPPAA